MIFVLRLLHIFSGAFWFGTMLFNAQFLMPALGAAGPAHGIVMGELMKRKMHIAMMGAAIVNVLSGAAMMFVVAGGDMGAWMQLRSSRVFAMGGVFAILAFIVGLVTNAPAAKRLGAITAGAAKRGGPPTPEEGAEIGKLQQRLKTGTMIVLLLLILAVAAMSVARYS